MTNWIDVTVPVRNGMVHWPGDPEYLIRQVLDQKDGDICTLSRIDLSVHTGTHMDAPRHFLQGAATMEQMPIDATIGPARVIWISDPVAIRRPELEQYDLQPGERILIKTANSAKRWNSDAFDEDYIFIAADAAAYMAERRIRTIGVDALSVGGFKQDMVETHQTILRADIWIIEGLNLSAVEPGDYELVCLPLKLVGSDGSPARAVLRKI
ncbi:MAG: arylformamidase [Bryobacterales bacterium]|nr:arylformamidase [Bryobacterales bacterium]